MISSRSEAVIDMVFCHTNVSKAKEWLLLFKGLIVIDRLALFHTMRYHVFNHSELT